MPFFFLRTPHPSDSASLSASLSLRFSAWIAGLGDLPELFSLFFSFSFSLSSLAAPPRDLEDRNARKGDEDLARARPRRSSDAVVMTESTVSECVRGTPSRMVLMGAEGKLAPAAAKLLPLLLPPAEPLICMGAI